MKIERLHPKQIPTTRKGVSRLLDLHGYATVAFLLRCFFVPPDAPDYPLRLYAAASNLDLLSRPVYRTKNGFVKLPEKTYRGKLFDRFAETPDEIFTLIQDNGVSRERAELIHRMLRQIADLVCPMMACPDEQAFISEYAYAIDYVIRRGGDLPKPEMRSLFPVNYSDYHYQEGIAKVIRQYEGV